MFGSSTLLPTLTRAASLFGLCLAIIFGTVSTSIAQVNITTPDTTLCGNTAGNVTLNATIGSSAGNFVTFTDDIFSGVVNIGFPFTFYGNTYTQCVLSSNGYITFDLSNAGQFSPWVISSGIPGNTAVLNSIMGPWADHYPPSGGTIEYSTQGVAPNRRFVFTFCSVPMFSCTNLIATFQIVLFETTNNIEIHISNMPTCASHNSGAAIEGIQNSTGTAAVVVPGRNYPSQWTAVNSSHRFTPSGTTYLLDTVAFGFYPSGINNISWFANGSATPFGTGTSVTVTPTAPAQYYVARANGCLGATSSDTVTVNIGPFLPAPGVASQLTYCQGTVAPPLNPTLAAGATAVWYDVATGGTALPSTPFINTTTPYRDTFYVMQTSGGCSSQRARVVVEVLPQPVATLAPDRDSMCLEETALVGFTGFAPPGANIMWEFGNAIVLNNPPNQIGPFAVQFPAPGLYNIGVVVTSAGGCNDAATTQIYVKEKPVASLDILLPDACAGDVRVVRHTVANVGGNFQFLWDFDGGEIVSGNGGGPYNIRWNGPGTKRVKLIVVKDGCYSEPAFDSINVYPQPNARILAPDDRTVCLGDTIRLNAEVSGNAGDVYRWFPASSFIQANYINNTNVASFKIPSSGYVTLQVLSRFGCEDRDSVYFDAGACCQVFVPSGFSPNGDGKNDYFRLLGTERTRRVVDIQVVNRYGQEVWRARDGRSGWDGTRGGVPQEPGVYFYRVQYECPDGKVTHSSGDVMLLR